VTGGIGNPDWQKRYVFSAVPILTEAYPDNTNSVSPIIDSNGYQYLIVTTNAPGSNVFAHVKVDWFQDQLATLQMGDTDWTIPPGTFIVVKVPIVTRFFKLEIGNVGGATGSTIQAVVYGTNADQDNLLTQNTAIPLGGQTIAAATPGTTNSVIIAGMFGGEVMLTMDDNVNNKWTEWLEYYDWNTQTWIQFWTAHGLDKGQAYTERVFLPYAPIRMNCRNDDTVNHILKQFMVAP
jgi:hypothetical protein